MTESILEERLPLGVVMGNATLQVLKKFQPQAEYLRGLLDGFIADKVGWYYGDAIQDYERYDICSLRTIRCCGANQYGPNEPANFAVDFWRETPSGGGAVLTDDQLDELADLIGLYLKRYPQLVLHTKREGWRVTYRFHKKE